MFTAFDILAENNFGDTRSGGLAGPLAGLIVVLMAIATVLLIRNMTARLRRLPDSFPAPGDADPQTQARAAQTPREAAPPRDAAPRRDKTP